MKWCDHGTATHTVVILPAKEILVKGFSVGSKNECMGTFFFEQETTDSVIEKPKVLLHDRMKGVDSVTTILQPETEQHHCLYHVQQKCQNPSNGALSSAGIDCFTQTAIAIQKPTFKKLSFRRKLL